MHLNDPAKEQENGEFWREMESQFDFMHHPHSPVIAFSSSTHYLHLNFDGRELAEDEAAQVDEDDDEYEDLEDEQEYSMLDKQLDDLNSALDALEQKNDSITSQLLQLLHNSRQVRQELAEERAQKAESS